MDQALAMQAVQFIQLLDKRYSLNKAVGWVYALRNSEYKRSLLKIGMTHTSPMQRARELGSATGVPGRFDLVYFVHSIDAARAEFMVHETLRDHRTTGEFFEVSVAKAIETMDAVAAQLPIPLDLARPKKQGGWGPEILPQAFNHSLASCPDGSTRNRVHALAIPTRVKCRNCGRTLS